MNTQTVLISANSEAANQRISELRQTAVSYSLLIAAYNALPVLTDITTAEQAKQFLTDAIGYLNKAIIADTGIKLGKVQPDPAAVAGLFKINYGAIQIKINTTQINPAIIHLFSFDETTLKVELMEASEEEVREKSKIYLSDPEEIEEYGKVKQLCTDLNDYFLRYNIGAPSMNQIPSATGLRCVGKRPGPAGYELVPNIELIKKLLNK